MNEELLLDKLEDLTHTFACFESYTSIEEFVIHYDLIKQDDYCKKTLTLIKNYQSWEEIQSIILNEIKEDVIRVLFNVYM